MQAPHARGRSNGQRHALSQAPMILLSAVVLLALTGCGGPASAWLTLPPVGAPDTIILSLAPDPARAGWLFAGSSQGDIYHFSATAERLPAPLSKLPTPGAIDTLLSDPTTPKALFASGTAGVFLSLDSGALNGRDQLADLRARRVKLDVCHLGRSVDIGARNAGNEEQRALDDNGAAASAAKPGDWQRHLMSRHRWHISRSTRPTTGHIHPTSQACLPLGVTLRGLPA